MSLTGVNRAQADLDIGERANGGRSIRGVAVGKSIDNLAWMGFADLFSDLVDEPEQQAGGSSALVSHNSLTRVALAPPGPIVLRNRNDGNFWMVSQPLVHSIYRNAHRVCVR